MKWALRKHNKDTTTSLDVFRKKLDNLFDDFFSLTPTSMFEFEWSPSVDVVEDERAIHVKAEIPGIDEKDLKVTLENNVLVIEGEKKEERHEEDKNTRYVVSERRFGSFRRAISLPDGIKTDKIRASFKKGVLQIEIPKDESAKPRKINIEVK
ncbi:MAG: Hsp20/alpha crystallin family protein [Spirochaetes bacterium]|nr:Hsp20/alpha crystallin family protein [Spirochaetota bacterium]